MPAILSGISRSGNTRPSGETVAVNFPGFERVVNSSAQERERERGVRRDRLAQTCSFFTDPQLQTTCLPAATFA